MSNYVARQPWEPVLDFWFPEERMEQIEFSAHRDYWRWRMKGGAHNEIVDKFSELTAHAATGQLNDWASDARGRLALIIVLDQFSRSVWQNNARAYAQDPAALKLVMEGCSNGHYLALSTPWRQITYGLPLGHCEGDDHLERLDLLISLREDITAQAPAHLSPIYVSLVKQAREVRKVIAAFGRHPHRNRLLGRPTTSDEASYIARKQFPHLRAFQDLA